jgi:hypothetical protein
MENPSAINAEFKGMIQQLESPLRQLARTHYTALGSYRGLYSPQDVWQEVLVLAYMALLRVRTHMRQDQQQAFIVKQVYFGLKQLRQQLFVQGIRQTPLDEGTLESISAMHRTTLLDELIVKEQAHQCLNAMERTLLPNERAMLKLRFGLENGQIQNSGTPTPQRASLFGLSPEALLKRERRILKRLKRLLLQRD